MTTILDIWALFILFWLGAAVGSFINAFEYRLKNKIDFVKKRSMCPKCKHTLSARDLIPIISFALIGGKCRYCGTKVSWQYPIIEFISGVLFVTSGVFVMSRMHTYGFFEYIEMLCISILLGCVFAMFLFFACYDMKHKIVPDKVTYPAIFMAFFGNVFFAVAMHWKLDFAIFSIVREYSFLWNVISGVFGGLFMLFIIILTGGKGMGGGDMKLMVLMGLVLGWKKLLVAFYFAIITGSVAGIIWGLRKGKFKGLKIPFAVFLSAGAIFSILLGTSIVDYYLLLFNSY